MSDSKNPRPSSPRDSLTPHGKMRAISRHSGPRISIPRDSLTVVGLPSSTRDSLSARGNRWSDAIELEDGDILEIHGPSLVEMVDRTSGKPKRAVPPPLPRSN